MECPLLVAPTKLSFILKRCNFNDDTSIFVLLQTKRFRGQFNSKQGAQYGGYMCIHIEVLTSF